MKYYKYSELVKEYCVSDRTVRNWVEASLQGEVDLKLHQEKGRWYVANTIGNNAVLENLAEKGKKYRNSRSTKVVEARGEFYDIFPEDNIVDLVNTLDKNRELSWSYSYFGSAASYWNDYLLELHSAGKGNLITDTIDTIKLNYAYLDAMFKEYDRVNVINICTGNNIAVHDLLSRLKASGKMGIFIAADISRDMLDVAESNIEKWFDGNLKMERCVIDIRNNPLRIIAEDESNSGRSVNVFLLVAGAIKNFENISRVLETVNASMSKDDIFITTFKRDTAQNRSFFDFNVRNDHTILGFNSKYLLDLLNIDESFYDVEQGYDNVKNRKYLSIKLKVNLFIHFRIAGTEKVVEFERGESILLWFANYFPDEQMARYLIDAGFSQLLTAQSVNKQLLLTVSKPIYRGE